MNIRYHVDTETGSPHIHRHGVTEDEVEDALSHPAEDRPGQEGSRVAIAETRSGRYVRVIYVPDVQSSGVFVVTAYELRGKPLRAFRRRTRRRKP